MRLFRLTQQKSKARAFDGRGAGLHPGRWNERNRAAVYVATSIALAILEILVQAGQTPLLGFLAYPVDVPDEFLTALDTHRLAPNWRSVAGRDVCRAIGETWRASDESLGLLVPSAVLPEAAAFGERNAVLNPIDRRFEHVSIGAPVRLEIDARVQDLLA
ncbi:MAG TPA: RES family NAD+ phosphorylase [Candidatus Tyrphobacter sp.]